ncbi:TetR/AcrR family transcriptional regulator [Streptomyces sp. BE20]|uniref:TetR/AcrR family transcriptional regulator n=1 Tax=Streptomyces sp. BE20 TaxID=3002525 RepID=UPI002E78976C|nr:TetR/AcrR family transcriptional regulator [Streptomyces sp. BE20]MEE1824784.1 TetR/AcrR family transcriptional regulator [Streptomyces sp. BE20]
MKPESATRRADVLLPGARTGRDPARSIKRGPSRLPPDVVAATQRERLLDGLVHTVAQHGYQRATVSDICRAAGVTRPVFYELFTGKEDAFLAAHRHGTGVVIRRMAAAFAVAPDWCTGIREALRAMLELLAGVPAFATMAVIELDAVGPAGRRERDQLLTRFRAFFAEVPQLPDGVAAEALVDAVVGGVYSMLQRCIDAGRTEELPRLLPTLSLFCLAPFLGPEEAARRLAAVPALPEPGAPEPSSPTGSGPVGGAPDRVRAVDDPSCTRIDPLNTGQ